jgi:hypothetical protein
MPISFLVPNSYAEVIDAINIGMPIASTAKSELAVTFQRWIDTMVERPAQMAGKHETKRRFGILGL